MDTERLKKIARFRMLSAQQTGQKIDLVRFSDDQEYAKQVISSVLAQSDHEELTVLALELLDQSESAKSRSKVAVSAPTTKPAQKPVDKIDSKYIGRLR